MLSDRASTSLRFSLNLGAFALENFSMLTTILARGPKTHRDIVWALALLILFLFACPTGSLATGAPNLKFYDRAMKECRFYVLADNEMTKSLIQENKNIEGICSCMAATLLAGSVSNRILSLSRGAKYTKDEEASMQQALTSCIAQK